MKFRSMLMLSCLAAVAGASAQVHAEPMETVTLPGSAFTVAEGQTISLPTAGWRYVEKIIVQAEGIVRDAKVEVMANGDTKGTIYAPGTDPSYIVTVAETVNSIQFRGMAGTMRIRDVKAVISSKIFTDLPESWPSGGGEVGPAARNEATQLSNHAIRLCELLEPLAGYEDYRAFILPIKKAAGRAFAAGMARSSLSHRVYEALFALKVQIHAAHDYLNRAMEQNSTFDLAVAMESLEEKLDHLL